MLTGFFSFSLEKPSQLRVYGILSYYLAGKNFLFCSSPDVVKFSVIHQVFIGGLTVATPKHVLFQSFSKTSIFLEHFPCVSYNNFKTECTSLEFYVLVVVVHLFLELSAVVHSPVRSCCLVPCSLLCLPLHTAALPSPRVRMSVGIPVLTLT